MDKKELVGFLNFFIDYMCHFDNMHNMGIVSGDVGLMLCLHYLSNKNGFDTYSRTIDLLIEKNLKNTDYCFNLGYGLSGFCLALQLTDRNYLIEEQKKDIDTVIEQEYKLSLIKNNLDYFNGASGYLFYLLMQNKTNNIESLIQAYVRQIEKNIKTNSFYTPFKVNNNHFKMVINMGTPHGITGILLLLLIVAEQGYKRLVYDTIKRLCEYLLYSRMDKGSKSVFPSYVESNGSKKSSAIAWCYGDLMISYAFLKAGVVLHENSYTDFGWNTLIKLRLRTDYIKNDLCLCHGYSSIMMIYRAAYTITHDVCFYNQSLYWHNEIYLFLKKQIEKYNKESEVIDAFFRNPSLLNGLPGCLLSLLFEGDDEYKWSKCLLL